MRNNENSIEEEPCRCVEGFQCYPINCEYCEKIPTCRPGQGLETKHGENVHNTEHPPIYNKSLQTSCKSEITICVVNYRSEEGV